ncbi:sugar porter family MFS transporter [Belliella sp. R4-6]|uniref:Sugar porter family MFS transporter n=1 Tax=Belliella alkalica TaxID=1730871 RepID=A0ABS9VEA3_9BACT|nr:sugar porter family MFS transporter [Belliella alkalica]MCH7414360.1 sugar porter family MFS transporter [Belliella alkalica]
MNNIKYNLNYILPIAVTSALGGFLFGYDWVVIGGAKPFYELFFEIKSSPTLQGWAMSSALIGCIFGAVISGMVSDKYGRKVPLIGAGILFVVSAFGTGMTYDFTWFIVFRVIGGLGIGIASTLSPLYIAEITPSEHRGRFVSINQLTIVLGILAAQIINYIIAEPMEGTITDSEILNSWNGQMGWRWMFLAELIPSILFVLLMFLVPKSPRFLVLKGRESEAISILSKIGGDKYAAIESENILKNVRSSQKQKLSFADITAPKVRPIMILGIVLAVFQQWCGINIIFNYAEEVFTSAGYTISDMLFNIVLTGSINLIFTIIAMKYVDSWGRKKLLLLGSSVLGVIHFILGWAYYIQISGLPILILVLVAIGVYAMSIAPVTWVVLSEIFPNKIRGRAMSIASLFLWIASFVLTYTFPIMNQNLGSYGTFWSYCFISILGFLFIKIKLPETKGKSLEEIEMKLLKQKL